MIPLRCAASSASAICIAYRSASSSGIGPCSGLPSTCSIQIIRPDVVECADVRMIQRGNGARLALEALAEFVLKDLDGDDAVQARVESTIHLAHAAGANRRKN